MNVKNNRYNKFIGWLKTKLYELYCMWLDLINSCDCPFDPEDNPFPQTCDKRIIYTKQCVQCPWRNMDDKN